MAESNTVTGARRSLGEQLRSLRAAAGVTQQGLAEKVGYSRSTVANVEVGRQAIDRAFWEGCDEVLNANGFSKTASTRSNSSTARSAGKPPSQHNAPG
jgi:DNA-binding XRE family transcriptional regulator